MIYKQIFCSLLFITAAFSLSCSGQRTNNDPLTSLRDLTKDGKMPAESVVADIERRFGGQQTGVLAKLLRARIRFENKDFTGAAALLDSRDFAEKTKLGEYALWLRGKALQSVGDHPQAMSVLNSLFRDHPDSIRVREAKLLWAESALVSGRSTEVPPFLASLVGQNDQQANYLAAKAYKAQELREEAIKHYRRTVFLNAWNAAATEATAELKSMGASITDQLPQGEEQLILADSAFAAKKYAEAAIAYRDLSEGSPAQVTPAIRLRQLISLANSGNSAYIRAIFDMIPANAPEREEGYRQLVLGYAKAKLWPQVRSTAEEMRQKFPGGKLTPKAWVDAGYAARDAKNKGEENYFLRTALTHFPKAVEIAGAQFELAWLEHESKNYAKASDMLIEHLAVYAAKDTTNRGKAGYWAARNSELAGKSPTACTLYETVIYRYSANWYGYLAQQRLAAMNSQAKCRITELPGNHNFFSNAIANLKTVTVAPETSGLRELERAEKSEQLSTIGLFDWAIDELQEAKKTAQNSPKINLALAKHYRLKSDNVNALLALAKSYPDYAQMFPEEMGREEWDIFYPHVAWDQIKAWAQHRNLDLYQVAGLIRQESVFNPTAASPAKAYGLMQLLVPTAQMTARKNGVTARITTGSDLFQPALNIELGTAYMRENLDKYGRIEYMAVAYNAGPGRVVTWRKTLPLEIDEFVEAIPFKETKGYVQGVIRNSAQYRRLYDENGNFRPNVGTKPVRGAIDTMPAGQLTADYPEVVVAKGTE